jgi:hypothetical protein
MDSISGVVVTGYRTAVQIDDRDTCWNIGVDGIHKHVEVVNSVDVHSSIHPFIHSFIHSFMEMIYC